MFKVLVDYPTFNEELEVARRTTARSKFEVSPVLGGQEILALQDLVRSVPVSDHVIRYALALVRSTRVGTEGVPDFVNEQNRWGAGPARFSS